MSARRTRRLNRWPLRLLDLESRIAPATFTVTNANNSGTGSLRQAVINANNAAGADSIDFSSFFNSPRTITLASQISITGPVTIDGPSAANVTISGNDAVRIFDTQSAPAGAAISLVDLTLTSGRVSGAESGGALRAGDESISATRCIFTRNVATIGGAISAASGGFVALNDSTITQNSALDSGGAVYVAGGPVTATNCEFQFNGTNGSGGAICATGALLSVSGCTFVSNSAQSGGAIFAQIVVATDCSIQGNAAVSTGGAVYVAGTGASAAFTRCDISDNRVTSTVYSGGGGMNIVGDLTLEASTVSGNWVAGSWGEGGYYPGFGGGALVTGAATIRNSTISTNSAGSYGGAKASTMLIQNSTITGNKAINILGQAYGGGLRGGTISIESSIVVFNEAWYAPDVFGGPVNARNSSIANRSGIGTFNDLGGNRPAGENPRLGPLQNNGGIAKTHLLLPGSPCFNSGSNPANLTTDQRGPGFPRVLSGVTDMGAAEGLDVNPTATAVGLPPTITSAGGTSYDIVVRYDDDVGVNLSTIDLNDIRVTGPGYTAPQAPIARSISGSGTVVNVTYTFPAPGGAFDFFDGGLYTVSMAANQVADLDAPSHFVAAGTLSGFRVAIPGTLTVDEPSDIDDGNISAGHLSLREAMRLTNAVALTADTIVFDPVVFGTPRTILLNSGEFPVFDSLTVIGPGADRLTLDAGYFSAFFRSVPAGYPMSISGLTLTHGLGGAIIASGGLSISHVVVTDTGPPNGSAGSGGVYVVGPLTMTDCTVSNNEVAWGAAPGGGIFVANGNVVIERSSIVNNRSGGDGGGLYFVGNGRIQISDSTFSGNSSNLLSSGIGGGGISLNGGIAANSYIRNSTISGNSCTNESAGGGLALYCYGTLPIANCTITGNTSQRNGGGIAVLAGEFTEYAELQLNSTMIAGNSALSALDSGPDLYFNATFMINVFGNNNLIGVANSGNFALGGTGNLTGTQASPLNPMLAPLANNGGPTRTHALLTGSPALNAGNNSLGLTSDQRGLGFGRVSGLGADIGAFEVQVPRVSSVRINDGSAQRSMVTSLTVTLSTPVTFAGAVRDAFTLMRTAGGAVAFTATSAVVNGVTVVTLSNFTGAMTQFGSLADGRYTLTALAGQIGAAGTALDGDGDGLPGGNYAFGEAQGLFRFYGDINGDRRVNIADFGLFSLSYMNAANYVAAFDFNGDGRINLVDFGQFSLRYLAPLP